MDSICLMFNPKLSDHRAGNSVVWIFSQVTSDGHKERDELAEEEAGMIRKRSVSRK